MFVPDSPGAAGEHGVFLADLEGRGYDVTVVPPGAPRHRARLLTRAGELLTDNVVLLARGPQDTLPCGLTVKHVARFVDSGGSVLMVLGPQAGAAARRAAAELGVTLAPNGSQVVDFFHKLDAVAPGAIGTRAVAAGHPATAGWTAGDTAVSGGTAMRFRAGGQAHALVRAEDTAFEALPEQEAAGSGTRGRCYGGECALVVAVQTRRGSRAVILGAPWAISDAAMVPEGDEAPALRGPGVAPPPAAAPAADAQAEALAEVGPTSDVTALREGALAAAASPRPKQPLLPASPGRVLATALSGWAFQESGVIRAQRFEIRPLHSPVGTAQGASDTLLCGAGARVRVLLEQRLPTRTEWAPLDRDDAQAEIGRAGVLVRQNLSSAGAGWHEAELRLPRDPGWFRLRLNFQRRGLTAVHLEEEVELVADGAAEGGPAAGFDVVVAAAPYICTLLAAMGVCLRAALCRRRA
ncbi:hypothetical protein FNF29_01722 [Cafeteria roenbergensis]|uniref:Dolichyl-diphosphooligosaccharide--protein glycosyltransferase 48 kDa subunit n=1 Tax=Cafeteria roenbergensis TaxID=33653 RepID=A0A5A8CS87_CAFRO|nr:hypothetical protein FNF29_01722 [Cafeteria roenbergensis]|eukprot:KAA0155347.1 hypothetical protein FNF29_01722 [Cafeteria roenbergensis]